MGDTSGRPLGEVLRDEMVMKDRICQVLGEGPKTIPEIAEALGAPPPEVTLWVMALRRYGSLEEVPKPKAEDYYRYQLVSDGAEDRPNDGSKSPRRHES